jgi:hypothetical protein
LEEEPRAGAVNALPMFKKVVFPMKPTFAAFARLDEAEIEICVGDVYFLFVALETGFVSKGFVGTGILVTDVGTGAVLSIVIYFNDYSNNHHTIQFKYILLSTAV